jgi:hypothetical protein
MWLFLTKRDQDDLKEAVDHYREALQILRTKSEFTTEELAIKKTYFEIDLAGGGGVKWSAGRSSCTSEELNNFQFHIDGFLDCGFMNTDETVAPITFTIWQQAIFCIL